MPGICGGIIRKFSTSKNEEDFCIERDNLDMISELSEQDMESSEENDCENFEDLTNANDDEEDEEEAKVPKREKVSRRKQLKERLSQRKESEARTVFVGNAPATSTRRDIQKVFRTFGTIEAVYQRTLLQMTEKLTKLMQGKDKTLKDRLKSTNFFVRFSSQEEAATAAREMNGTQLGDKTIRVMTSNRQKLEHSLSIFVGNLPYTTTDDQLRVHFASCGPIFAVRVLHNRNNGMCIGVAYVQFEHRDSREKALALNGHHLCGRPLRVSKVAKKKLLTKKANVGKFSSSDSMNGANARTKRKPEGTERFVVLKGKKQTERIGVMEKKKAMRKKGNRAKAKGGGKRQSLIS